MTHEPAPLTLDWIEDVIARDKASIPALYAPGSPPPDEDFSDPTSERREAVAEAQNAVSTLREYLRSRAEDSQARPE